MESQMELKEELKQFADENGILLGVCDASRLDHMEHVLSGRKTPFTTSDVEMRIDPKKVMPSAKSIVVIGKGYKKQYAFDADSTPRGVFANSAVGVDYHIIVGSLLEDIAQLIKASFKQLEYKAFVDSGPLLERELAKKAGLGFSGKNCSVISEKLGSFFGIGILLVNVEIENDLGFEWNFSQCGICRRCVLACPTGALGEDGFFVDASKCISYITQKKGELTEWEKDAVQNKVYGCDTCQTVCPYNKNVETEPVQDVEQILPDLVSLSQITKQKFDEKYKNSAIHWRGADVIRRNALIGLENFKKQL